MTIAEFCAARLVEAEEGPTTEAGRKAIAIGRRILTRHRYCGYGSGYCDDGGHDWGWGPGFGCADLADLASHWQDHPDFPAAAFEYLRESE